MVRAIEGPDLGEGRSGWYNGDYVALEPVLQVRLYIADERSGARQAGQ
jgi:hypothetical protein